MKTFVIVRGPIQHHVLEADVAPQETFEKYKERHGAVDGFYALYRDAKAACKRLNKEQEEGH